MVQKIFDNLMPGGYFEFQDPCFPMLSDDKTLNGTALEEYALRYPSGPPISHSTQVLTIIDGTTSWSNPCLESGVTSKTARIGANT